MTTLLCIILGAFIGIVIYFILMSLIIAFSQYFDTYIIQYCERATQLYILIWMCIMYYYWNVFIYYTKLLLC